MKNLKKLRDKKGLTQIQLAKKLKVCEKTISRWENGIVPDRVGLRKTIRELLK